MRNEIIEVLQAMQSLISAPVRQICCYKSMCYEDSIAGVTILVDPWLVGELTFYGTTWAYTGRKGELPPVDVDSVAAKADIIVLTQVGGRSVLEGQV